MKLFTFAALALTASATKLHFGDLSETPALSDNELLEMVGGLVDDQTLLDLSSDITQEGHPVMDAITKLMKEQGYITWG